MSRIPRRERLALVRMVVNTMPDDGLEKKVSRCYMRNFCDLDIRDELEITKKALLESRAKIKQMLVDAGVRFEKGKK